MKKTATFNSKIQGIPCGILVTRYTPMSLGRYTGPPEFCYEDEPAEMEFEVLDRYGYQANWLDKKLSDDDYARLIEEYETFLKEQEG